MSDIDDICDTVDSLERVVERMAQAEKHTAMELAKLQDQIYYMCEMLSLATDPDRAKDNALLKEAYDKYMFTVHLVLGKE
jgi:hypoxanthine phosphoribosyltransferase